LVEDRIYNGGDAEQHWRMPGIRLALLLLAAAVPAAGPPSADSAHNDSLRRYAAIRHFVGAHADELWPGLGAAPFDILLVGTADERLYCRDSKPEGFSAVGPDPITECATASRPRTSLPAGLLAAMPVFGTPSTIVMGTQHATGRSDADWTRTILHEHFHQWQDALPGYYPRIAALGLSGGDQTGMWMLNFPFPYSKRRTVTAFNAAARALGSAVDARGTPAIPAGIPQLSRGAASLRRVRGPEELALRRVRAVEGGRCPLDGNRAWQALPRHERAVLRASARTANPRLARKA
jgi:hypothetical protein